jgi:GR25 family glycosyltransferase involved in LPS biosynthesis
MLRNNIYVINLISAKDRYKRFDKRWSQYEDQITYIDAITSNSDVVKWTMDNYVPDPNKHPVSNAECACMLSHLKAIETFISDIDHNTGESDNNKYCIIMEDDARQHIKFGEYYNTISDNLNHDILLLTPYMTNTQGMVLEYIIDDLNFDSGCTFMKFKSTEYTYSTLAYRISLRYAKKVIQDYGYKQFKDIKIGENRITAEHITRYCPDSYSIWPPLCIDEALDTSIQHESSCFAHRKYNDGFGQEHYAPI